MTAGAAAAARKDGHELDDALVGEALEHHFGESFGNAEVVGDVLDGHLAALLDERLHVEDRSHGMGS